MNYYNYVIYMPTLQIVKFGITGRIEKRIQEIGRIAARRGESRMQWASIATFCGVARITEAILRRELRAWAQPGHFEWVTGGKLDFQALVDRALCIQSQLEKTLGVSDAH